MRDVRICVDAANRVGGILSRFKVFLLAILCTLLIPELIVASHAAKLPEVSDHKSIGAVSCASSLCHGATAPWNESNILHDEYTTWLRLDRHARAYNVLLNNESKLIAKKLGLDKPAHEAKICLDCHAHNPPIEKRGDRFVMSDGVSCEACHGGAEKWVSSHIAPKASHASNIEDGLYPTDKPVELAKLCISCHFGNENKLVTHRIMGAGHPRLSFDLETFALIQPAHYKIDSDWRARKMEHDAVRVWAIGQAIAARELLVTLIDPKLGKDGLFPELVLFDCHACHHPMSDKRWMPRQAQGVGPGRVRLNDANLLMVRSIVKAVNARQSSELNAQILRVHKAVSGEPDARNLDVMVETKKLIAMLDQQIDVFQGVAVGRAQLISIMKNLIDEGAENAYLDYSGAEQAFMAVSSVSSFLHKNSGLSSPSQINSVLAGMRKKLQNDEQYDPEKFKVDLLRLKGLLNLPPASPTKNSGKG